MCVPSLFEMLHWPHDVRGRGKQWQDALNGSTAGRGDWRNVNAQIIGCEASDFRDNVLPFPLWFYIILIGLSKLCLVYLSCCTGRIMFAGKENNGRMR